MTWKPEDIVVGKGEATAFMWVYENARRAGKSSEEAARNALAAFLAARMPKPKGGGITHPLFCVSDRINGYNAALDDVARGRG